MKTPISIYRLACDRDPVRIFRRRYRGQFHHGRYAMSTFGGIVVENSYVASQEFNGWLEEARQSDGAGLESHAGAPI